MKIAVIMTVHNRRETTIECLRNLFRCTLPEKVLLSVHLMDDGSTDGTSELVQNEFPQVKIVKGNGNLYWNRGMYECWKIAITEGSDFYLWLNDDTYLYNNAIEELLEVYNNHSTLSIVTGQLCSRNNTSLITYGGRIGSQLVQPNGEEQAVDTMNGNVVLVPDIVVKKVGILYHFYRHQWGDLDYGNNARRNGVSIYITRCFVGTCEPHVGLPKCFNPNVSLRERIRFLFSPIGPNPIEYTIFNIRNRPFNMALVGITLTNIHHNMRTFFPKHYLD